MLVAVVGPPGAGKGTLRDFLVRHHGFKLLSTEAVLRRASGGGGARDSGDGAGGDAASRKRERGDVDSGGVRARRRTLAAAGPASRAATDSTAPIALSSSFESWPGVRALRQRAGADAFAKAAWTLYMDDWTGNYVIEWPMDSVDDILLLRQRSLFFLYAITASTAARFARQARRRPMALEAFVERDACVFQLLQRCMDLCDDLIVNEGSSDELARGLVLRVQRGLAHTQQRPPWDTYFMRLAFLAARRSNCMKRRVGAIVVRDNRVVSTGYNGTPRGLLNCSHGGCPRCNSNAATGSGLDECLCLHAEENAIMEAGAERCRGCTVYSTSFPCLQCTKRIIQVGISRVVFAEQYATDDAAGALLAKAGVQVSTARDEVRVYRWHDLDCRDGDVGAGASMAPFLLDEPPAAAAQAVDVRGAAGRPERQDSE